MSRQFAHLRRQSLERLQALVPAGCPLVVRDEPPDFVVELAADHAQGGLRGRYQVVAAFIQGFVLGWDRGKVPV